MKRLGMSFISIEHWYEMDVAVYGMSRAKWLMDRARLHVASVSTAAQSPSIAGGVEEAAKR